MAPDLETIPCFVVMLALLVLKSYREIADTDKIEAHAARH
jgi:hypothetical protein